jgi:hypothetical protein
MTNETAEIPKTRRGWPKGKSRKPPLEVTPQTFTPVEAPIHVRLRLKDYGADVEFGCARRLVENGFHIFFYPSKRDPYRETRREFSIAQIIEIEITEARQVYDYRQPPAVVSSTPRFTAIEETTPVPSGAPVVHSAKQWAMQKMAEKLEGTGLARIDSIPGISFGGDMG